MTHRRSPHHAAVTTAKIRKRAAHHQATNKIAAEHRAWRRSLDYRLQSEIRERAAVDAFLDAGGDPAWELQVKIGSIVTRSIEDAQMVGRTMAVAHPKPKPFQIPTWWDLRRKA